MADKFSGIFVIKNPYLGDPDGIKYLTEVHLSNFRLETFERVKLALNLSKYLKDFNQLCN